MRRIALATMILGALLAIGSGRVRAAGGEPTPASALDVGGCFGSPGRADASAFATTEERKRAAWHKEYYSYHPPLRDENLGEAVRERRGEPNEDNRNPQPDHENSENKNPQPDHFVEEAG